MFGIIIVVVVLVVVVAYGVYRAVNSPPPVVKFEKSNVSPQYRCPGTPVTVSWASQGKPVKVELNGKVFAGSPSSAIEIAASDIDVGPDDTTIKITIDAAGGESVSYDLHTIRGVKMYDVTASETNTAFQYDHDFPKQIWADNILFIGVKLEDPLDYLNDQGKTIGCAWQYTCSMSQTGTLSKAQNNFEDKFNPPVKMDDGRKWVFRLANPPSNLRVHISNPKFKVIVMCPK